MRYALLSDIHANLEALTAVLSALDQLQVHQILNLGDTVGYNTSPNECLALLSSRNTLSVIGNHDRAAAGLSEPDHFTETARAAIHWTRNQLTPEHKQHLASLPLTASPAADILLVHAALHPQPNDEQRITSDFTAHKSFEGMRAHFPQVKICFFGHTHLPAAYAHNHITTPAPLVSPTPSPLSRYSGRGQGEGSSPPSKRVDFPNNQPPLPYRVPAQRDGKGRGEGVHPPPSPPTLTATVHLRPDSFYLINPGSAGQPRDHDLRAAFAIYDSETQTVDFHRTPYDLLTTQQKLHRSGILPTHPLLQRLTRLLRLR